MIVHLIVNESPLFNAMLLIPWCANIPVAATVVELKRPDSVTCVPPLDSPDNGPKVACIKAVADPLVELVYVMLPACLFNPLELLAGSAVSL